MPIIIDGYLVARIETLRDHARHHLSIPDRPPLELWCVDCQHPLATYIEPEPHLPCGCRDQEEHDEGLRLQAESRTHYRVPKGACVGCFIRDDGPSMHDCYIHRA